MGLDALTLAGSVLVAIQHLIFFRERNILANSEIYVGKQLKVLYCRHLAHPCNFYALLAVRSKLLCVVTVSGFISVFFSCCTSSNDFF